MKKNESGRSMVEMLGVLAIIGVLSVGGIAGYTMAMKKYRNNEAAQAVALAAVECLAYKKITTTSQYATFTDANACNTTSGAVKFGVANGAVATDVCALLNNNGGTCSGDTFTPAS